MRTLVESWCSGIADEEGWLGGTYGFTDDNRFVGIVRFTDSRSCIAAAQRPGAAAFWAEALELLDSPVDIHQSDDVTLMFDGGADDAGFVQVLTGQLKDAAQMRYLMADQDMTAMLPASRPEILGATLAISQDGTFTETIAFTDEALARQGETIRMPEQVQRTLNDAVADVAYLDLRNPWFASHR
ncbi:hypothetical protein EFL95_05050 [Nocardioides marmorisolisilvae]|uniref:Uncharacterized protein n=2 Tax=Nocardioides marmorisolisilvae TaxID=1542737 RepID=A0A3N0DS58_9ACTN|nr:hypothetical protein EFL95_05050 [Nocardioides marmorisolisilvae]